jgi:multicomponent K+:H+ antiporter subunit C
MVFQAGRIRSVQPPLIPPGASQLGESADPLPQALILTAIVIGFATTALFLVLLLALRGQSGTDHVDGREPEA